MGFIRIDDPGNLADAISRPRHRKGQQPIALRLKTHQAVMAGPEVSVARAASQLSRVLSDREASEVIVRREIHAAQGRRILTAGHQVHLCDELARPSSNDAGEFGVISEGMLAILTETQGQPLKRRVLGRPVGFTINPDGAEDPTAWRLG